MFTRKITPHLAKNEENHFPCSAAKNEQAIRSEPTVTNWKVFTQNTTFHGIGYIFRDSKYQFRSVLWALLVLGAVTGFVSQVAMRMMTYYNYSSNVNIQVVYTEEVPLPAVTICNQNRYRLVYVASAGVYQFLNEYYGAGKHNDIFSRHNLSNIDFKTFAFESAHQQYNFIEKCHWQGEPCDSDNIEITPIYTELGLCYTITGRNTTLHVTDPGAGMGLSLFLNVEQYEHMKGPVGDAGVKILLHETGEIPLMKDLGFSVATGTHTLVAVKRSEIHNLPLPYGECVMDASPMTGCLAKGKTEEISQTCQCGRLAYRNLTGDSAKLCSFQEVFRCAEGVEMKTERKHSNGTIAKACSIPCDRTVYEPSLSYAQLSKFNIKTYVLRPQNGREEEIEVKYQTALEIFQTYDQETNKSHVENVHVVTTQLDALRTQLGFVTSLYWNSSLASANFGVGDIIANGEKAVQNLILANTDNKKLKAYHTAHYFTMYVYGLYKQLELLPSLLTRLSEDFYCNETQSNPCDESDNETLIMLFFNLSKSDPIFSLEKFTQSYGPLDNDTTSCLSTISNLKDAIRQLATTRDKYVTSKFVDSLEKDEDDDDEENESEVQEIFNFFYSKAFQKDGSYSYFSPFYYYQINSIFNGSLKQPWEIPDHVICGKFLSDAKTSSVFSFADKMIGFLKGITKAETYHQLKNISKDIKTRFDTVDIEVTDIVDIAKHLTDCGWFIRYNILYYQPAYDDPADMPEYVILNEIKEAFPPKLLESFSHLGKQYDVTQKNLANANSDLTLLHSLFITNLNAYLAGNMTRLEWAETMTSISTTAETFDFLTLFEISDYEIKRMMSVATTACDAFRKFMRKILDLTLPLYMKDSLLQSDIYERILKLSTAPFVVQELSNMMIQNASYHMDNVLRLTCEPFTDRLGEHRRSIENLYTQLQSSLAKLEITLAEYIKTNQIDTKFYLDNFLQVDIFYKEMSYEKIDQQIAFEALSLFSEIGGFLGLLLGASLLTVCELIDFLFMSLLNKIKAPEKK